MIISTENIKIGVNDMGFKKKYVASHEPKMYDKKKNER